MVGDISGNIRRMRGAAARAAAERTRPGGVFGTVAVRLLPRRPAGRAQLSAKTGCRSAGALQATRQFPDLHWVVGAPTRHDGPGKPLHNSLLVLKNGQIRLRYDKQLLPTYNIFDERRHFEPGSDTAKVLRVGNCQVGFLVCEDGWNDQGADYATNPFVRMGDAAPDLVISINASPSHLGKREQRHEVFTQAAARHKLAILYSQPDRRPGSDRVRRRIVCRGARGRTGLRSQALPRKMSARWS